MFGIGVGEDYFVLYNFDYDFFDVIILVGIDMYWCILEYLLECIDWLKLKYFYCY